MKGHAYSLEEVQQLFFDALRSLAKRHEEEKHSPGYAIFLGDSLYPMNDQVFSTPGHARNSLYHNLSSIVWCNAPQGREEGSRLIYSSLGQQLSDPHNKRKLVDAALAAGLISFKPVVLIQGQRPPPLQTFGGVGG